MEKYPRDLLKKFLLSSGGSDNNNNIDNTKTQTHQNAQHHSEGEEEEEDEGVELNLGLSLGGRFGVDKHAKKNKLTRSSSVVGTMPLLREDAAAAAVSAPPAPAYHMLMRASSLPTETEEQWRKRKELQSLRRMEAKRRRSEKQRVNRSERDTASAAAGGGATEEVDVGGGCAAIGMKLNRCDSSTPSFMLQNLGVGTTKQIVLGDVLGKGKTGVGFQGLINQPSSQGSTDSQGGSSSSVSEMDSKPFLGNSNSGGITKIVQRSKHRKGPSTCGEARSPGSNQSQDAVPIGSSLPKTNENIARTSSKAEVEKTASKKPQQSQNMGNREIGTNSIEDMPCVFTKGEGPNGRRIEGILYKYGKGEEVRIMCVCHGNFLSPAEFVKHAGGGDVEYPLRHIVINPSAAPFS